MYAFLLVVHVFVCFVLVAVILLQAGRGGGLSEMMGGGQPQSILGTQTNKFMTRATEVCAVLFIVTSLTLAVLTTQRGKSLIEKQMLAQPVKTGAPLSGVPNVAKEVQEALAKVKKVADTAPAETAAVEPKAATPVTEAKAASAVPAAKTEGNVN